MAHVTWATSEEAIIVTDQNMYIAFYLEKIIKLFCKRVIVKEIKERDHGFLYEIMIRVRSWLLASLSAPTSPIKSYMHYLSNFLIKPGCLIKN